MDAFESQLIEMLPRLRAYALILTRNRAQADDTVQESAAKMLAARNTFIPGTNFKAWAYRVLRNTFLDGARSSKSKYHTADDAVMDTLQAHTPDADDRILLQQMLVSLDSIPAEQKESLLLVYGEGLQYEEVAEVQGCSVGTVKSRVFRAKEYLEKLVSHNGPANTAPNWSKRPKPIEAAEPE